MKVLLISNWYPNRTSPFNGDFVQRHAEAISQHHSIELVHFVADSIKRVEVVENSVNTNFNEKIIYFPKSSFTLINSLKKSHLLWKELKKNKEIDLIHLNVMYYHFWPLLFWRKPLLITEHYSGYLSQNIGKMSFIRKGLSKLYLQKAFHLTTVSQALRKGIRTIQRSTTITVIPNVVDTQLFHPIEKNNDCPTFLHLSNLAEVKNVQGILNAIKITAAHNRNFKFKIGGNGDIKEISEYREQNKLEDIIEILPAMQHWEVAQQMQGADAFVLFSHYENQPCVIGESFSSGLPVIATDVGGVSEFFPENFGILIPEGDTQALSNAMLKVMEEYNFEDKNTMHAYAEETFSKETIAQQFSEIYRKTLKE